MIQRILSAGFISHAELESVIGRLPATQTSVFGRIGRRMMAPLYAKLRADPYHPVLSDRETATLAWRAAALPNMEPASPLLRATGMNASFIPMPPASRKPLPLLSWTPRRSKTPNTSVLSHIRTGDRWKRTFASTSYIYTALKCSPYLRP